MTNEMIGPDRRVSDRRAPDEPTSLFRRRLSISLRVLLPALLVLFGTNAGAWFRLEQIADQRDADRVEQDAENVFINCATLAAIDTKLRSVFTIIADSYPQSEALRDLATLVAEEFPFSIEQCPPPGGELPDRDTIPTPVTEGTIP